MSSAINLMRRAALALMAGFILLPLLVALVLSFSADTAVRFPVRSWGLRWYETFLSDPQWRRALANSVQIAVLTTALSVPIGTAAAWTFVTRIRRGAGLWYVALIFPLFLPGVALGLALAMTAGQVSLFGQPLYGGAFLVALAHSLLAAPLVFMVMETALRTLDPRLIEAASDLGASPLRRFFGIALPLVRTSLLAAVVFAFVVSLNEFVLSLFLTTRDTQTLPVLLWLSLRSATSPLLAVATTVLTLAVGLAAALGLVLATLANRQRPT